MNSGNRVARRPIVRGLAALLLGAMAAPAMAQTQPYQGYTQSYGATMPGPATGTAVGTTGVGTSTALGRPAYQSNVGLPYGPGNPAPYAYGGGLPSVGTPAPKKAPVQPTGPGAANATTGPGAGAGTGAGAGRSATGTGGSSSGEGTEEGTGPGNEPVMGTVPSQPFNPRSNLPVQTYSGPGNGQPVIKAAPDYKPGDLYARGAGAPAIPGPIGTSPYQRPYTVDALGNYYTSGGAYVGKVDSTGQVRDRYGNVRGTVQRP